MSYLDYYRVNIAAYVVRTLTIQTRDALICGQHLDVLVQRLGMDELQLADIPARYYNVPETRKPACEACVLNVRARATLN